MNAVILNLKKEKYLQVIIFYAQLVIRIFIFHILRKQIQGEKEEEENDRREAWEGKGERTWGYHIMENQGQIIFNISSINNSTFPWFKDNSIQMSTWKIFLVVFCFLSSFYFVHPLPQKEYHYKSCRDQHCKYFFYLALELKDIEQPFWIIPMILIMQTK